MLKFVPRTQEMMMMMTIGARRAVVKHCVNLAAIDARESSKPAKGSSSNDNNNNNNNNTISVEIHF